MFVLLRFYVCLVEVSAAGALASVRQGGNAGVRGESEEISQLDHFETGQPDQQVHLRHPQQSLLLPGRHLLAHKSGKLNIILNRWQHLSPSKRKNKISLF